MLTPRIWCEACREWHADLTPGSMTATPMVPGCTGKVRHATREDALQIAGTRHTRARRLVAYRCAHCAGWHLSRTTPGQHTAAMAALKAEAPDDHISA